MEHATNAIAIFGAARTLASFRLNREKKGWVMDLGADNIGRRDQRFDGLFVRPGKFKGYALWDQIPMLMSQTTQTLFTEDLEGPQGVLTIQDPLQLQVQAVPGVIAPVFHSNAVVFTTDSRRYIGLGGFEYIATPELTIKSQVQYTDRQGMLPYGGSFGHSSLVEVPAPIDHRLADVDAGAEYSRGAVMFRAGYSGSFFHNEDTTVTYDSPFRLTDVAATPSRGRNSLPPSNSFVSVNGMASVKMPARSRATAYVSMGQLKDAGDPLMPQTINSANPTLPLERDRVNGEARTSAVNLTFVSRPARYMDLNVRYRSYDYDNRTPVFTMNERVSYDNAPSAVVAATAHTEAFSVLRNTLDADFRVSALSFATAGIGYSRLQDERTHRIFESTTDNVLRVTFDSVGNSAFSLRTKFEHAERRGEGIEGGELELAVIGEHPGMRHFDVAPRDRNRRDDARSGDAERHAVVQWLYRRRQRRLPPRVASDADRVRGSVRAAGQQAYRGDLRPGRGPERSRVAWRLVFLRALQRAQPLASGEPWRGIRRPHKKLVRRRHRPRALRDGDDRLTKIGDKVDLQLSYDYNRARALYEYIAGQVPNRTLPEETVIITTLPPPEALPAGEERPRPGNARSDVCAHPAHRSGGVVVVRAVSRGRLHARRRSEPGARPRFDGVARLHVYPVHGEQRLGPHGLSLVDGVSHATPRRSARESPGFGDRRDPRSCERLCLSRPCHPPPLRLSRQSLRGHRRLRHAAGVVCRGAAAHADGPLAPKRRRPRAAAAGAQAWPTIDLNVPDTRRASCSSSRQRRSSALWRCRSPVNAPSSTASLSNFAGRRATR